MFVNEIFCYNLFVKGEEAMATKLKNMKVTSVDLVRAGANQEADICLFKSADTEEATESPPEDEIELLKQFITSFEKTSTEADNEPHSPIQKADLENIYKSAIVESLRSIIEDDTLSKSQKKSMAKESVKQFEEKMRELNEMEDRYDDDDDEEDMIEEIVEERRKDRKPKFDVLEEVRTKKA